MLNILYTILYHPDANVPMVLKDLCASLPSTLATATLVLMELLVRTVYTAMTVPALMVILESTVRSIQMCVTHSLASMGVHVSGFLAMGWTSHVSVQWDSQVYIVASAVSVYIYVSVPLSVITVSLLPKLKG